MAPPDHPRTFVYSPAVVAKTSADVALGGAVDFTWNGYWRSVYEKSAEAIRQQADDLARRGILTYQEAAELANAQRNALVMELRKPLTPFGKFYSEVLKPADSLPSVKSLLARKGTYEAILQGSARTRQAVNKLAFTARVAGPAVIAIDVVLTMVVVADAPANEREEVAAEQIGGMAGSVVVARYGGLAGAWAGAGTFALIGSPTLVIPVVGEVTEGGLALVGGVVGFFAGGWLGWGVGQRAGAEVWQMLPVTWTGG